MKHNILRILIINENITKEIENDFKSIVRKCKYYYRSDNVKVECKSIKENFILIPKGPRCLFW